MQILRIKGKAGSFLKGKEPAFNVCVKFAYVCASGMEKKN